MKQNILLIIGIILWFPAGLQAQDDSFLENDSIEISEGFLSFADSLALPAGLAKETVKFKPDPKKAILYSALFPGLGQIYNRKYWKLPIVYGGFLGCAYAISWNGTQYRGYKQAYSDFTDNDPNTKAWEAYNYKYYYTGKEEDPAKWDVSSFNNFKSRLKSGKDYFRRNLELSYIITVGVYAIFMIDAYVDAQLFEFDISEDLSLKLDPVIFERTAYNSKSFGLQCSITF
ncbi:hypothetical protein FACS189437_02680 [Bacteroidia bacterium]|nr:hypothetical protein FACS189437_02680 [Bacteroidia bacterium]